MGAQSGERPYPLILFYVLFFMTVGVSLPFMPGYFKTLGFTGAQSGTLLAVGPLFALFMPPLWGQLADRTGKPGLILLVTSGGGAIGYALLSRATTFTEALLALSVHAAFASSITSLADTLALHHVQRHGGTYAGIRTWGSLGFVLASLPFGFLIKEIDRTTVLVPFILLSAAALACALTLARLPGRFHEGPKPSFASAFALARQPPVILFLLATALHWIACAPYHGSLAPHVKDLGLPPWVVGVSSSVGVISEILVMATWSRWAGRISPRKLLLFCFLISSARWTLMSLTSNPWVLVAAAAAHGLTFGAFYLASVEWMVQRAPGSLRATGQTLFVAATFGVGGIVGYRTSGGLYDRLGGHQLFAVAAVMALLPALVMWLTPQPEAQVPVPAK
ncbi:MAG: MFS transporter [Archangium sp.]|nr:MFS transporter [Archangium sp.]MDP3572809.1 MFS transporter [Archangium sp.]